MLAPRHWEFGWFLELSVINSWVLGWVFLGGRGDLLFCFALGVVVYGSFLGGTRACTVLFLQMGSPIF